MKRHRNHPACGLPGVRLSDRRRTYYNCPEPTTEETQKMSASEIELSDGSTFGIRPSGASEVEVPEAQVLDMFVLVLSKAARIARDRREGKRPPRTPEQTKDHEAEVERLVTLSQQLKATGPANAEVDRLVTLSQQLKEKR